MTETKYEPGIYVLQGEDAPVLALHAGPWWFPFLHEADAGEKEPWGEVLAGPISIGRIRAANELYEACLAIAEHDRSGGVRLSFDEIAAQCRDALRKADGQE